MNFINDQMNNTMGNIIKKLGNQYKMELLLPLQHQDSRQYSRTLSYNEAQIRNMRKIPVDFINNSLASVSKSTFCNPKASPSITGIHAWG